MFKLSEQFFSRIAEIQGGKPAHTINDLVGIVDACCDEFDLALQEDRLFPYTNVVHFVGERLDGLLSALDVLGEAESSGLNARVDVMLQVNRRKLHFTFHNLEYFIPDIESARARVAEYMTDFHQRREEMSGNIELKKFPNIVDGTDVYLPYGVLIAETTIESPGCHVFQFGQAQCAMGHSHTKFTPKTTLGFRNVAEAIGFIQASQFKGTLLAAAHVLQYPLEETVLPILSIKYDAMLDKPSTFH